MGKLGGALRGADLPEAPDGCQWQAVRVEYTLGSDDKRMALYFKVVPQSVGEEDWVAAVRLVGHPAKERIKLPARTAWVMVEHARGRTYVELAGVLGISAGRVGQVHDDGVRRLRWSMSGEADGKGVL